MHGYHPEPLIAVQIRRGRTTITSGNDTSVAQQPRDTKGRNVGAKGRFAIDTNLPVANPGWTLNLSKLRRTDAHTNAPQKQRKVAELVTSRERHVGARQLRLHELFDKLQRCPLGGTIGAPVHEAANTLGEVRSRMLHYPDILAKVSRAKAALSDNSPSV